MSQNQILREYVKEYALGGKAVLVVENTATKEQRRFLIKAKYIETNPEELVKYSVYDVYGGKRKDNWLGSIYNTSSLPFAIASPEPVAKNFAWVWKLILTNTIPNEVIFYHLGACSICGRPLKDAISLNRGIGPECWKKYVLKPSK